MLDRVLPFGKYVSCQSPSNEMVVTAQDIWMDTEHATRNT